MNLDDLLKDLQEDSNIDENNLESAMAEQPTLYLKYAIPSAEAEYKAKQLTSYAKDTVLSKLQLEIRQTLIAAKKPTLKEIEQQALVHEDYLAAKKVAEAAERERIILQKAERAMLTKADMLRSLNSKNKSVF